jgi:hypothetical protein
MSSVLEVQDLSKIAGLVMPFPRYVPRQTSQQTGRSLAAIEMAMPSISMSGSSKPAMQGKVPEISLAVEPAPAQTQAASLQGWVIPVGYSVCCISICLCNIVYPWGIRALLGLLMPLWSSTILLHAATQADVWMWWGVVSAFLAPFIVLVADWMFVAFYILVFTGFGSCLFWRHTHGVGFILICVCLLGVLLGCSLSVTSGDRKAQLSVAGFCSVTAAVLNTVRLSKLTFRVSGQT